MPLFRRPDGELVRDPGTMRRIMPYIMKTRNESVVYFDQVVDVTQTLEYLRRVNAGGERQLSLFQVVLCAAVRTLLMRPLLNQTYMVMLIGAGIDMVIADPLDKELMEWIRIVEERDESTALNRLLLKLHDRVEAMEELQPEDVDMSDPQQVDVWKTVQVLLNKVIYTDSYLRV